MKYTFASHTIDDVAMRTALDTAPDGNAASNENWNTGIITHGGGSDATIAALQHIRDLKNGSQKIITKVRLSPEVVHFFKASGHDWKNRLNEVLKEYVSMHSSSYFQQSTLDGKNHE